MLVIHNSESSLETVNNNLKTSYLVFPWDRRNGSHGLESGMYNTLFYRTFYISTWGWKKYPEFKNMLKGILKAKERRKTSILNHAQKHENI